MVDNENNYTNEFENETKDKKSFKKTGLIIAIIFILGLIVFFYVVTKYIPEKEREKEYISDAYEDLESIKNAITEDDYFSAIDFLNKYESKYSNDYGYEKAYKKLAEEMRAENVCPKYLGEMVQTLENNINESLTKLDTYTFDINDRDTVSAIVNGLGALQLEYPEGITYTTENGNEEVCDIEELYNEYYYSYRCEEIILDYLISDKSMKYSQISNMNGLANTEGLDPDLKNRVLSQLNKMKAENKATDFAVTGGSAEIYLFKNENNEYSSRFGWVCPNCGYDSDWGTPRDVSLEGHYIGEKITYSSMMICAGKWVGGCGKMSEYTLEITYK